MKKIDSHQHFWIYSQEEYEWMDNELLVPLRQDLLPDDLNKLQEETGYSGSVAVQARQKLEETQWLLDLSDSHPELIKGVVGWVDLRSPDVTDQLASFAGHPRFKGVRHVVQDEPDDHFMLGEEFQDGIATLEDFGLTYDILIFPKQLPASIELVKKFPNQPFVLDHIAKPHIKDGTLDPWKEQIQELASFDNVTCKVSGMVTEADWEKWKPADFKPYLDCVVEAFSPSRLMVGSDWPVCTLAGSYGQVTSLVEDYFSSFSETEKQSIFAENAIQFYQLDK